MTLVNLGKALAEKFGLYLLNVYSTSSTYFFLISWAGVLSSYGQKVTVSPEISIRNNVAYDIIGRIDDRILFYREKGNNRDVLLYDDNLVFQSERQINLDDKRCYLYEVVNLDTAFAVIYDIVQMGMI